VIVIGRVPCEGSDLNANLQRNRSDSHMFSRLKDSLLSELNWQSLNRKNADLHSVISMAQEVIEMSSNIE